LEIRKQSLTLPLYDHNLCDEIWTRGYYYKHQRVFKNTEVSPQLLVMKVFPVIYIVCDQITLYKKKKTLSTHNKFRKASAIGVNIDDVSSQTSNIHFQ